MDILKNTAKVVKLLKGKGKNACIFRNSNEKFHFVASCNSESGKIQKLLISYNEEEGVFILGGKKYSTLMEIALTNGLTVIYPKDEDRKDFTRYFDAIMNEDKFGTSKIDPIASEGNFHIPNIDRETIRRYKADDAAHKKKMMEKESKIFFDGLRDASLSNPKILSEDIFKIEHGINIPRDLLKFLSILFDSKGTKYLCTLVAEDIVCLEDLKDINHKRLSKILGNPTDAKTICATFSGSNKSNNGIKARKIISRLTCL